MTLAPQSRAGDRARLGRRLGVPSPAAARAPSAPCLPPAALPSPPPALSAPAPTEPPSPAPPLGVAAAAAASPAAENEAASRSPGRALGHLIRRAGAPARPDGELRRGGPSRPSRPGRAAAAAAGDLTPAPDPTLSLNAHCAGSRQGSPKPGPSEVAFPCSSLFGPHASPTSSQKLAFRTTSLKKPGEARRAGGERFRRLLPKSGLVALSSFSSHCLTDAPG